METPLNNWVAGSYRQQSASAAVSSTRTHIPHSRIYSPSQHTPSATATRGRCSDTLGTAEINCTTSALFLTLSKNPGVGSSALCSAAYIGMCLLHVRTRGGSTDSRRPNVDTALGTESPEKNITKTFFLNMPEKIWFPSITVIRSSIWRYFLDLI